MRRTNWRVVFAGGLLVVLAVAFFFGMWVFLAPKSDDPVKMMQAVGQAAGFAGGAGLVIVLFGLIGKKQKA
jgi:hypothetical protein